MIDATTALALVTRHADFLVGNEDIEDVAAEWEQLTMSAELAEAYVTESRVFTAGAAFALHDAGVTPAQAATSARAAGWPHLADSVGYHVANGDLRATDVAQRLRDLRL